MFDAEARLQAIETIINDMQAVLNNLATTKDVVVAVNTRQSEIDFINTKITSLKLQVELLQAMELTKAGCC
jgi:hypothetical protein